MKQYKTIAAIATPIGKSALAIVRLSGPEAFKIVSRCVMEKKKFETAPGRCIFLSTIIDSKTKIPLDEATVIKYAAPRSFTGENMVEIICHGGPRIIEEIAATLLAAGATPAGKGDFSQRAHANGKIDLLKAEAIRGMIESTGDIDLACARKLYNQETEIFKEWRMTLIELCANVEAVIEFNEEGGIDEIKEKSLEKAEKIIVILKKELNKREKIRNVENFIQIVIAGLTNAGKSSLFNLLLGQERSIVHTEHGTTRDIVRERVCICGYQVMLIDSAGIRETKQEIEKEGILRSRTAMENAGIIIWVTEATKAFSNEEINEIRRLSSGKELICVINKTDLSTGKRKKEVLNDLKIESVEISIKEKKNIEDVIKKIGTRLKAVHETIEIPDIFLNQRQEEIGKALKKEMCFAIEAWERPEIAAHHLKKGINLLDELFGKTDNEEILNKIFTSFCIGK
jgi:tRNA modification GTPase